MYKNQRGQMSFLLVTSLLGLIALFGLVVDAGLTYYRWTDLSRAVDDACASVIRVAGGMSEAEITANAERIAEYNIERQGLPPGPAANVVAALIRNAAVPALWKLNVSATKSSGSLILSAMGNFLHTEFPNANLAADATCPTCYNNPLSFPITPVSTDPGNPATYYDAGMLCQQICNDGGFVIPGTSTACPFFHTSTCDPSQVACAGCAPGTHNCTCASSSEMVRNTEGCNPNAFDPGTTVGNITWMNRTSDDMNAYETACNANCVAGGDAGGVIWCNETAGTGGGGSGPACCKCHCVN